MAITMLDRRRRLALPAIAMAALLALVGCASGANSPAANQSTSATTTPATAVGGGDAFPVTIDTAYGEITVNEKPKRIFAYDGGNLEFLSRLGQKPAAWTIGRLSREEALQNLPYLQEVLDTEPNPEAYDPDGYTLNAEAIALLKPDLILANPWVVDERAYAQLSQIAPTYAGREAKRNDPWQDTLTDIASLTGHEPKQAVADAEAELKANFEAAAERLPGLQGATVQVPILAEGLGFVIGEIWGGSNWAFLGFGLKPGEGQAAARSDVSFENIERLNADVLIIGAPGSVSPEAAQEGFNRLREDPRFADLPAVKNDAVVWMTLDEYIAVNGPTPASVTWWLDQVVPRLEASDLNKRSR